MNVDFANVPCLLVILTLIIYLFSSRKKSRHPHPPGPPGYPIIGNVQLPDGNAWKEYRRWSDVYGMCAFYSSNTGLNQYLGSSIVRVNILGTNIVILNSLDDCVALLDKRSSIYSDRFVHSRYRNNIRAKAYMLGPIRCLCWSCTCSRGHPDFFKFIAGV